ncbi:MAG: pyridoxamine 5'-phosphate oxidase family protein [bacterium]|nr:pyridoxamine 5'-phosphate oxidase family protein [bacterium]
MTEDIKKSACDFAKSNPTSHLATIENNKPHIRVMYCPRIDDDLTVWFTTSAASNKVRQIMANPDVALEFFDGGKTLKITGTAIILNDQAIKDELWEEDWTRYFKNGKEDPDYCIIKVKPVTAEYLDMNLDPMTAHHLL